MNLDAAFWLRLTGTLAVESALVVGGAWVVQRFVRSGAWKRTAWQIAIVSMLLLTISELSGLGQGLSISILGRTSTETARQSGKPSWTVTEVASGPVSSDKAQPSAVDSNAALTAPPESIRWPGGIWALGMAVVLTRIVFAQFFLVWLRFRWSKESDPELTLRVAQLGKRLGMTQRVRLLRASGLASPIAFGWLRPCIGLPADFTTRFHAKQQETILAHELGHLAARDPLWYLIADVASAFLWWLPFAWLARRNFQWASELAADEASFVVEDGAGTLAECLVGLAREGAGTRRWARMGIAGNKSNFGQRVERLLKRGNGNRAGYSSVVEHRWPFILTKSVLTVAVAFALVLGTGWLHGQGDANPGSLKSLSEYWRQSPAATMMTAIEKDGETAFDPPKAPANGEAAQLFSKTWHVDPDQLLTAVKEFDPALTSWRSDPSDSPESTRSHNALRTYLTRAGVDFDSAGKSLLWKARPGWLLFRGSIEEIEIVDKLMSNFPAKPTQVLISMQFADFNEAAAKELGLDWVLGDAANPDPSSGWKIGERRAIVSAARRNSIAAAVQTNLKLGFLEGSKVTTLSGRQARVGIQGIPGDSGFGRTVDLMPQVMPDMRTIHLVVVPQIFEAVLPTNGLSGLPEAFSADLYDSQSLVVVQKGSRQWSVALVEVNLVDPIGNRINPSDEMPFATNSIPQQPASPTVPKASSSTRNMKPRLNAAMAALIAKQQHALTNSQLSEPLVLQKLKVQEPVSQTALKIFKRKFPQVEEPQSLTNAYSYITAYLKYSGVKFDAPKTLVVNHQNGMAFARCAPSEKPLLLEAAAALNSAAPQVEIEARVLELDAKGKKRSALNALLKSAGVDLTPAPIDGLVETTNALDLAKVRETQEVTNLLTSKLTGVLSESQFRAALEGVTKDGNANFLAAPRVTTVSDQEVNLSSLKFYYPAKLGSTVLQPLPEGVAVQFRPHVVDEERSVEFGVTSTTSSLIRSKSKPSKVQVRQVSDTRKIQVGQTMVLCGLSSKDAKAGKDLVVFVTPRVIDPTGKQVK